VVWRRQIFIENDILGDWIDWLYRLLKFGIDWGRLQRNRLRRGRLLDNRLGWGRWLSIRLEMGRLLGNRFGRGRWLGNRLGQGFLVNALRRE
jgi:hypothetical protein